MRWLRLFLILAAITTVYCYRLGQPLLWADEADTGIFARNVLRSGYPTAYDGRNISVADDGAQLSRGFLSKKIPWVQYYVGAASLALAGNDTAGLRLGFALLGVLTFFPLQAALRRVVPHPDLLAALALLAPQVVLFQRSARYYPILILLYAVLVWHLSAEFRSQRWRWLIAAGVMVLLFHTHPFAAGCTVIALGLYCAAGRREALGGYLLASAVGFASWAVWYGLLGPSLASSDFAFTLIPRHFGFWCEGLFLGTVSTVIDLDAVDCLPLLLWAAALGLLAWRDRPALRRLLREPLVAFVLLNVAIQAVATGALFGPETLERFSILRYLPHLALFSTVAGLVVLSAALRAHGAALVAGAAVLVCNILTFSYWVRPLPRTVPLSWAEPTYAEILRPPPNPWDSLIARMRSDALAPGGRDHALVVWPPWTEEIMNFYLGDVAFVRHSSLNPAAITINQEIYGFVGEAAYRRMAAPPEWLVEVLPLMRTAPAGYALEATFSFVRPHPDNSTRPELVRHPFGGGAPLGAIRLFRRQP